MFVFHQRRKNMHLEQSFKARASDVTLKLDIDETRFLKELSHFVVYSLLSLERGTANKTGKREEYIIKSKKKARNGDGFTFFSTEKFRGFVSFVDNFRSWNKSVCKVRPATMHQPTSARVNTTLINAASARIFLCKPCCMDLRHSKRT